MKRKLSQSEVDRMVQEAEKSRDEDEVNESKHEAESGLQIVGNPRGKIERGDGHG